jgi:hypothetical protein
MPTSAVVPVPPDLQAAMQRQGLAPTSFALVVRFTGPSRRAIRLADGHETELVSSGPDYSATLLIWGDFRNDPDVGAIWYQRGNYGCDGNVRSACQL